MSTPKVTVYITNHNYGRFIRQAIESVLAQTLQDFELLIIDDGSTDNSRAIIEEYAERPRIQVICQQNKGLNITNNLALRAAHGRYLVRLDADDYLDPHALEILSGALDKDPELGLVFPDYYLVDGEGQLLGLERRHNFEKEVTLLDQPAHGACTMIRRDNLLAVGGYDEAYTCQDGYELWIKFATRFRVKNINLPLFYYRQHGNNLTRNEERILSTRSRIKQAHVESRHPRPVSFAVLPVRGASVDPGSVALLPLGEDRRVVDWSIEAALAARQVDRLVVTSSDDAVLSYVQERYSGQPRLSLMRRPASLARLNSKLEETIGFVLAQQYPEGMPALVVKLACEYPFLAARHVDDALNTLLIFEADLVVGVRPETAVLYQHHGHGLEPILNQDRFTRLEREALFRMSGGLLAFRTSIIEGGFAAANLRRSHVVIDQRSAHGLFTEFDLRVASLLEPPKSP